ncbi:MAG: hypothetical protein NTY53_23755, partial [Kiritimatiellaeota bacterium]|nr:hypothetical protein [Kiritimatiellota bacterium]
MINKQNRPSPAVARTLDRTPITAAAAPAGVVAAAVAPAWAAPASAAVASPVVPVGAGAVTAVLVGFVEGGSVDIVHRRLRKFFDQREAMLDQRQFGLGGILWIGKAGLVQIFDQIFPVCRGQRGIIDCINPDGFGDGIGAHQLQRLARDVGRHVLIRSLGRWHDDELHGRSLPGMRRYFLAGFPCWRFVLVSIANHVFGRG